MKLSDLKRNFVVNTKTISPNVVKVTLTLLDDLKLTANGKAEQEMFSQFDTFGTGKDVESAQENAYSNALKLAKTYDEQRIRIQIVDMNIGNTKSVVTLGFGEFKATPTELFGLGSSPIIKRVEVVGFGSDLVDAQTKALKQATQLLK